MSKEMPIVKVRWIDAQLIAPSVQDAAELLENVEPIPCEVVGFLLANKDDCVVVAHESWPETNQVKYVHVIPKCSIIKVTRLKGGK